MTRDLDLSITICSWNTVVDLRLCLASLLQELNSSNFEIIVVDNASSDGSPDMVESEFPMFKLLRMKENLGFTGGHNLAIEGRSRRHVALLNSDTIVHPGAIEGVMNLMLSKPEIGVVGPRLLNPDGSLQFSCRRFPNPIAAAFRNTILGRWFPNNRFVKTYLMQDFNHDEPREVDWVSGAALFIRGEVVDKIGGLDPTFFMYCEDTDFCKRVWQAGFKVMYLPQSVITHAIGKSTDKAANRMIVRFHRSMFRYFCKHDIKESWFVLRPFLWLLAAFALSVRASLFLSKNLIDEVKRRIGRS